MTASVDTTRQAWRVEVVREHAAIAAALDVLAAEAAGGPFQQRVWLNSWYEAFRATAAVQPRLVVVRDADGRLALALPLILRQDGGLRVAEFADCNLTDYNAPLLGPAAPRDPALAEQMWRRVQLAGLGGADLLRLKKMPLAVGNRPNPLALLPRATTCLVNGNLVVTGDDYDAWRFSLERTVRKELERSWRVYTRREDATFRRITDTAEALRILAVMEQQQSLRMSTLGQDYTLDDETAAAFYRRLIVNGLPGGEVVLTALICGETLVAGLLGIRDGGHYVMIRISHAGPDWANCSPGRLVIERSMALLHQDGVRRFDFSIGNYDYKRRFGVVAVPLVDKIVPLGWRALPSAARAGAVQVLRRYPTLERHARRWLAPQRRRAT
jgi:CelD/BcsL family acetyltransferase involved in cellulose biosynthesis